MHSDGKAVAFIHLAMSANRINFNDTLAAESVRGAEHHKLELMGKKMW